MKLPRDLSGARLIRHLTAAWGYRRIHQVGSHVTLETDTPSKHRVVAPDHAVLRVGTLAAILAAVARHRGVPREEVLNGLR